MSRFLEKTKMASGAECAVSIEKLRKEILDSSKPRQIKDTGSGDRSLHIFSTSILKTYMGIKAPGPSQQTLSPGFRPRKALLLLKYLT